MVKFNGIVATVIAATTTQLKVIVPIGATTGKITVEFSGQTVMSAEDFTVIPAPTIIDFTPKAGKKGDEVIITGANFDATAANNQVKFNGVLATITTATTTTLKVTVPSGVTTGKVSVTTNRQTATTTEDFHVLSPAITDFFPKSGKVGDEITIIGVDFDATAANNAVKFNGTTATVMSATSTELKVIVAKGTTTGKITLEVHRQIATSAMDFTFLPAPIITDFSPKSGKVGDEVIITGTNFDATAINNTVKFNGTTAAVISATTTELKVIVSKGTTTGKITVEVNQQTAISVENFTFLPAPIIIDFSPKSGKIGDEVMITGTNFDATAANNTVKFNGTTATVISATTTELKVIVSKGTTTGKITVEANQQTATSTENFTFLPAPIITDFSPKSGKIGDEVMITGANFDVTAANNTVKFNGATATIISATATELRVTVPQNTTTGKITVEVNQQTATSDDDFTLLTNAPIDLTQTLQNIQLTLFPNPVVSILTLKLEGSDVTQMSLTAYNMLGESVLQNSQTLQNGEMKIDVSSLPSGQYILEIQAGTEMISRKILKQ